MLLFQDISEDEDEKMWTPSQKAECILWYHEDRKPKNVQIKFRKKYGKNAKSRDHQIHQIMERAVQGHWILSSEERKKNPNGRSNNQESRRKPLNS